jgi:hypothetical protein
MGRLGISPSTCSFRCTLFSALVVALDCWSSGAASGNGAASSFFDEEQPVTRAAAVISTVTSRRSIRTALRGRVCMTAS